MTRIWKVIGPPGCGKTDFVAKQCRIAADKYGPERVVVCSLTKAAAREAAGRETSLPRENVGTLHALCYRGLGRPRLIDRGLVGEWNSRHGSTWALPADSFASTDADGESANGADDRFGDAGASLIARADLLRAQRVERSFWPIEVRAFDDEWRAFKAEVDAIDFTDMIELAVERLPLPPRGAQVLFVDEAQDLSRLELDLIERWSAHTESAVLVGDPWQALYSWRGASADVMAPPFHKILGRSWRVPRAAQEHALRIVRRCSEFVDFDYAPRDEEGEFFRLPWSMRDGASVASEIERAVGDGASIMLLATCSYMLSPALKELRLRGIPYSNSYSPGRWSPLLPTNGVGVAERVLALLACAHRHFGDGAVDYWSARQIKRWVPLLKGSSGADDSSVLLRGCKAAAAELPDVDGEWALAADFCGKYVVREAHDALLGGDMDRVAAAIAPAYSERFVTVRAALERIGARSLRRWLDDDGTRRRGVTVGTVHSVKGGEADRVIYAPDLSPSAFQTYGELGWSGRDAILRTFYVAATRARHSLSVLRPAGGLVAQEAV